jgi:predicted RNA polymerase sigma factor
MQASEAQSMRELEVENAKLRHLLAEALGLLAFLLHSAARREAQFDSDGCFLPLQAHNPADGREDLISEDEEALWMAARLRQPGPFPIEAAIHLHMPAPRYRAYTLALHRTALRSSGATSRQPRCTRR